jgi:DMSO/TMAO reductase YedYZ molybdopterin-dependent catalytic subunit
MIKRIQITVLCLLVSLAACTSSGVEPTPVDPERTPAATPTPCVLDPLVAPTRPAEMPGYTELDPTTGLHMTGTPVELDLASYRLEVTGKVDNPLSLTVDDLRCMPRVEQWVTIVCPGFFQDQATFAGASLEYLLDLAQVQDEATRIRMTGADGYYTLLALINLSPGDDFVAYEWEGQPLPILHGFPVRAVFPAQNGNKWVKWLLEIELL